MQRACLIIFSFRDIIETGENISFKIRRCKYEERYTRADFHRHDHIRGENAWISNIEY